MAAHARYSPSKLDKLRKCLGWQSDPTPWPSAMRGTAIHGELAAYVNAIKSGADVPGLSELATVGARMFDDLCTRFPDLDWQTEIAVDTGIPECYGTSDLIGVGDWDSTAVLLDWKTGTGKRDNAADSYQMAAYAIGIIRKYKHITHVICIMAELEQEPTECIFTRKQLDDIAAKIACLTAMADTATPADWTPSKEACRYCVHSGACSAQGTAVATIASQIVPAKTAAGVAAAVATMEPVDVAAALDKYRDAADLVAQFIESLEGRAKKMLESGLDVPGWTLKSRATARKWTVPDSRVLEVCATYEIDPHDLASPAEIEKRLAKKRDKKQAAEILSAISAKGQSETLVKMEEKK